MSTLPKSTIFGTNIPFLGLKSKLRQKIALNCIALKKSNEAFKTT